MNFFNSIKVVDLDKFAELLASHDHIKLIKTLDSANKSILQKHEELNIYYIKNSDLTPNLPVDCLKSVLMSIKLLRDTKNSLSLNLFYVGLIRTSVTQIPGLKLVDSRIIITSKDNLNSWIENNSEVQKIILDSKLI